VPEGPDRPDAPGRAALFPASRSHEQELLERLYGDRPIPGGFDLAGELIRRVRRGEVRLEPSPGSGWYDHQTWSLEPLVVPDRTPEARHLVLTRHYRKHQEQLFRAALALARETHVKQLAAAYGGFGGPMRPTIFIRPGLTVEPLPSLYLRRAAGYRFVWSALEEAFGASALTGMRRLTPEGPRDESLVDELQGLETLFTGARFTACRELGLEEGPGEDDPGSAVARFAAWSRGSDGDPDLARDARMMVPVFYDEQRRKTKVWAFLGWREVSMQVSYEKEPRVVSCEPAEPGGAPPTDRMSVRQRRLMIPDAPPDDGPPDVWFMGDTYSLPTPVTAEVYVDRLLDRDEFRRHCDRHRTAAAILANLR
jgi:hypothetical protein